MATSRQVRGTSVIPKHSRFSLLPFINHKTSQKKVLSQVQKLFSLDANMKWPQRKPKEVKPFLVLPLLEGERSASADPVVTTTDLQNRNSSSGSTGTWPPKLKLKMKKNKEQKQKGYEIERPLTATLERPELLNISLLDKLDMSLVRKEFLCITNLCKDTVNITVISKGRKSTIGQAKGKASPPSICVTPNEQPKRSRKPETSEDSLESDENSNVRRSRKKALKINKLPTSDIKTKHNKNDANNNSDSTIQTARVAIAAIALNRSANRSKGTTPASKESDAVSSKSTAQSSGSSVPEPCKTCGRPDAPERFHSHPATPSVRQSPRKPTVGGSLVKSSVQKPVAIKFKSVQRDSAPHTEVMEIPLQDQLKPSKGPRTLMCYICGREFGTKSLPLHEPKCLQKWKRENSSLPRHLQREAPLKPTTSMTSEDWNKQAWEASQAALSPCANCGRTFLPDRLLVHQRSCKPSRHPTASILRSGDLIPTPTESNLNMPTTPPGTVECYICGRKFGSKSIKIHEPQCLRKWHLQNNLLPPAQRQLPPERPSNDPPPVIPMPISNSNEPQGSFGKSSERQSHLLPCYVCGKQFPVSKIYIHEPECLQKFKVENAKLPESQRKKEPQRPDIKFTVSDQIEYGATSEALWQNHLSQLVPCKNCNRTFNPDRVTIHERSCKASGGVDFFGTFNRIWENHLNELIPCKICGRKFFPDRIEIHEKACKNLPVKVKPMNSIKVLKAPNSKNFFESSGSINVVKDFLPSTTNKKM